MNRKENVCLIKIFNHRYDNNISILREIYNYHLKSRLSILNQLPKPVAILERICLLNS